VSIRFKVILPYLLLTLIVAITGAYVVTRLVTDSLSEGLNNQLLEAGRFVSDGVARQEVKQINNARIIVYTRGVTEALRDEDHAQLATLATPTAKGLGIENLFLVNTQGQEILHLQTSGDEPLSDITQLHQNTNLNIIQSVLENHNSDNIPSRAISKDPVNQRWYYFTAIPIRTETEMLGMIIVGTSMDTIMPDLKNSSLADIVIYGNDGHAIASTLDATGENNAIYFSTITIPLEMYQQVTAADKLVMGQSITAGKRFYSAAYGKLQVGDQLLGVFAVVLPSNYVLQTATTNRNLYFVIFSFAMAFVILIGFFISRRIVNPLVSLVQTSQAIAGGDLNQRTGIRAKDEIGTLANSFDEMTEHLQQRTVELEKTNQILEQMDHAKASFINISAHELRTPLTLIQGYTYMLQQKAAKDPELKPLTQGLMDGFNRMDEVVNSMLDISRIDSRELTLSKADKKISLIIAKAQKPFKEALQERRIKLIVEGLDKIPPVHVDGAMLQKVFYHLIMNAIKYTPNGGSIKVKGRVINNDSNAPEVEIAVQDTGIGIDPQNHELVFEKFYQTGEVLLHSSGKTKFKGGGPGLGLAIARGIVEAHGGRIWLESPGHDEKNYPGTTFFVRLPMNDHQT
jgi:signal transduction histidine kinase